MIGITGFLVASAVNVLHFLTNIRDASAWQAVDFLSLSPTLKVAESRIELCGR